MKRAITFVLCLCFSIALAGCGSSGGNSTVSESCNLSTYKKYAQPLMQEFSDIVQKVEIREEASRRETKSNLEALLARINQVKCREEFPLKHETLVYSVKHMIDAMDYGNKGDYEEMNNSINKSLLNVESFQDWTVDVD